MSDVELFVREGTPGAMWSGGGYTYREPTVEEVIEWLNNKDGRIQQIEFALSELAGVQDKAALLSKEVSQVRQRIQEAWGWV